MTGARTRRQRLRSPCRHREIRESLARHIIKMLEN